MKFFVSLLVLALIPMMALNDLGRPAFIGYYLGVITLWLVLVGASARAARVPTTGSSAVGEPANPLTREPASTREPANLANPRIREPANPRAREPRTREPALSSVFVSLPRIRRKKSKLHGFGVFAAEPINKNTRIIDYAGELVRNKDSTRREVEYPEAGLHLGLPGQQSLEPRRGYRRQHRPVHQPFVYAELLDRDRRQDHLDSCLAPYRTR